MKYNFIAIEGNIGAGKTTLAHALAKELNAGLVLEEFDENPFLAKFYENAEKYAFPLELFFMAERYKQLKELPSKDLFQPCLVSDYMFTKCLLFAKVNLPEEEFKLYRNFFDIMNYQLPAPDILVYLHAPVNKLQQNIKKRNRDYEQSIADQYLLTLQQTYTNYIKQHNIKCLFIDASNADFDNNKKHINTILRALNNNYTKGPHYFTLP